MTEAWVPSIEIAELEGSIYVSPEQAGVAAQRAIRFKESLTNAQEQPVQVLDFSEAMARGLEEQPYKTLTNSTSEAIARQFEEADHVYLYANDAETAKRLERMRDMLISRTSIGESSAHQVFFAMLSSMDDKLRVAVKPFTKDSEKTAGPSKAIIEWTNTLLARISGLNTFNPIGLLISDGVGYTITERQDDGDPLDNVDWTKALMDPEHSANMIDDLKKIGPTLARLHDMGCFHGDPQMKNVMLTQRGAVHFIDWESATFAATSRWWKEPGKHADDLYHKTIRDLRVLFSSLARSVDDKGVGLLQGMTHMTQYHHFNELILTPYLNERIRLIENDSSEATDTATIHLGEVEEEIASYIKSGKLYDNLRRTRHTTHA